MDPAFHVGDAGSNPAGDAAKNEQRPATSHVFPTLTAGTGGSGGEAKCPECDRFGLDDAGDDCGRCMGSGLVPR